MIVGKEFRFPVDVHWSGGRVTRIVAPDRPDLDAVSPFGPEGLRGAWSPEDLLVGAAGSSFALELAAAAERHGVPLRELSVRGEGHVGQDEVGRLHVTVIELEVDVSTDDDRVEELERVVRWAKQGCLVTRALEVPVHVDVTVRAADKEVV